MNFKMQTFGRLHNARRVQFAETFISSELICLPWRLFINKLLALIVYLHFVSWIHAPHGLYTIFPSQYYLHAELFDLPYHVPKNKTLSSFHVANPPFLDFIMVCYIHPPTELWAQNWILFSFSLHGYEMWQSDQHLKASNRLLQLMLKPYLGFFQTLIGPLVSTRSSINCVYAHAVMKRDSLYPFVMLGSAYITSKILTEVTPDLLHALPHSCLCLYIHLLETHISDELLPEWHWFYRCNNKKGLSIPYKRLSRYFPAV